MRNITCNSSSCPAVTAVGSTQRGISPAIRCGRGSGAVRSHRFNVTTYANVGLMHCSARRSQNIKQMHCRHEFAGVLLIDFVQPSRRYATAVVNRISLRCYRVPVDIVDIPSILYGREKLVMYQNDALTTGVLSGHQVRWRHYLR